LGGRSGLFLIFFPIFHQLVKIGCQSRTMFDNGRKNKLHNFQTLLHPPTHTACRPQCGLPLASPSLSLGQKPKTGLPTQAQAVLTPPKTTTEASSRFLFVFLPDCSSFYDDLKIIKKKFIACFLKCKSAFVFWVFLRKILDFRSGFVYAI